MRMSPLWILLLALASLGFGSCGATGPTGFSPRWGLGLTPPNQVFTYEHWQEAPEHCRTGRDLLEAFALKVTEEREQHGCTAQVQPDLAGNDVLRLRCPVATDPTSRCRDIYLAQAWVERDPASTVDYALVGLGTVRQRCEGSDVTYSPARTAADASVGISGRLRSFVKTCERPGPAPIASLSRSPR